MSSRNLNLQNFFTNTRYNKNSKTFIYKQNNKKYDYFNPGVHADEIDANIKNRRNDLKMEMILQIRNSLIKNFLSIPDYTSLNILSKKAISIHNKFNVLSNKYIDISRSSNRNYLEEWANEIKFGSPKAKFSLSNKNFFQKNFDLNIPDINKIQKRMSIKEGLKRNLFINKNKKKPLISKRKSQLIQIKNNYKKSKESYVSIEDENEINQLKKINRKNNDADLETKEKIKEIIKKSKDIQRDVKLYGIKSKPSYLFMRKEKNNSELLINKEMKEDVYENYDNSVSNLNIEHTFYSPKKRLLKNSFETIDESIKLQSSISNSPIENRSFKQGLDNILNYSIIIKDELKNKNSPKTVKKPIFEKEKNNCVDEARKYLSARKVDSSKNIFEKYQKRLNKIPPEVRESFANAYNTIIIRDRYNNEDISINKIKLQKICGLNGDLPDEKKDLHELFRPEDKTDISYLKQALKKYKFIFLKGKKV